MTPQEYFIQQALAQPADKYNMLSSDLANMATLNNNSESGGNTGFGNWNNYERLLGKAGFSGGFQRTTGNDSGQTYNDPSLQAWINANRTYRSGSEGGDWSDPTDLSGYYTGQGYNIGRTDLPGNMYLDRVFKDGKGTDTYETGTYSDPAFAAASAIAMAIMTGGAAAAGLGSMGGAIGSSLGLGSGPLSTAVGSALLNTGMQLPSGDISGALKNGAMSIGGAYLGQQAGGGGLMNSLTGGDYSIEPNSFDTSSSGGGMFDFLGGGDSLGYTMDPQYMPSGGIDFGGMNVYSPGVDTSGDGLNIGNFGLNGLYNTFDPSIAGSDMSPYGLSGLLESVKGFLGDKGNAQLLGGLLGAAAGASNSGSKTQTSQQRMDPRMDPYVYGNNGLLAGAADWFGRNRGGNPLMNEGAQMQADFYKSPQYTQGFGQLRDTGLNLLGSGIAGNPFMSTGQPGNTGIVPPQMTPQMPPQSPLLGGRMTIMPVRGNPY